MTEPKIFNVLFLCTGNSARSILAEGLLNHWGRDKFRAFSAGSQPKSAVHPLSLETLKAAGIEAQGYRSKSWNEFARSDAPLMDFIFTVCDQAAGETCPYWPGQPMTAHWGLPDPAAVEGDDETKRRAFREAYRAIENRIKLFTALPFESLDRMSLQSKLSAIGKS